MPLITIRKIAKGSIRINLDVCHLTSSSISYSVPSSKKPYLQSTRHAFHFKELRYSSFTQPEVQPAKSVAHRLGRKSMFFPVLFARRCPPHFLQQITHLGFCCCQDAAKNPYPGFEGPQFPRKRGFRPDVHPKTDPWTETPAELLKRGT